MRVAAGRPRKVTMVMVAGSVERERAPHRYPRAKRNSGRIARDACVDGKAAPDDDCLTRDTVMG